MKNTRTKKSGDHGAQRPEHDAGGDRDVERLDVAGHGKADDPCRSPAHGRRPVRLLRCRRRARGGAAASTAPMARRRRRHPRARSRSRRGTPPSSSGGACSAGTRKCAPAPLRTAFAFQRSAVPGSATTAAAPSAAAVRTSVPDVAGILYRVEHEQARGFARAGATRARGFGHVGDRENALRVLGVGGGEKLASRPPRRTRCRGARARRATPRRAARRANAAVRSTPRTTTGERSSSSTVRTPSATNCDRRSLALRRLRSLARVNSCTSLLPRCARCR